MTKYSGGGGPVDPLIGSCSSVEHLEWSALITTSTDEPSRLYSYEHRHAYPAEVRRKMSSERLRNGDGSSWLAPKPKQASRTRIRQSRSSSISSVTLRGSLRL
jgi:hypothetical protein